MNAKEYLNKCGDIIITPNTLEEYHQLKSKEELPTEAEIVPIIDSWVRKSFGRKILNCEYVELAKAITNLLKGER